MAFRQATRPPFQLLYIHPLILITRKKIHNKLEDFPASLPHTQLDSNNFPASFNAAARIARPSVGLTRINCKLTAFRFIQLLLYVTRLHQSGVSFQLISSNLELTLLPSHRGTCEINLLKLLVQERTFTLFLPPPLFPLLGSVLINLMRRANLCSVGAVTEATLVTRLPANARNLRLHTIKYQSQSIKQAQAKELPGALQV